MVKSILPPLHMHAEAATAMRAPSAVSTLVVVWVEAKVALPHFLLRGSLESWLLWLVDSE
jgi:hypothetical protein